MFVVMVAAVAALFFLVQEGELCSLFVVVDVSCTRQ